jgi:hypothetical protein
MQAEWLTTSIHASTNRQQNIRKFTWDVFGAGISAQKKSMEILSANKNVKPVKDEYIPVYLREF